MKKIVIVLTYIFVLGGIGVYAKTPKGHQKREIASHVIFIAPDGFSSTVVRDNPGAFPNLERLMREGSYTLEKRSVLPSSSAVNWASIFMGAGPELHGYTTWGSQSPDLPSRVIGERGLFPSITGLLRDGRPESEIGIGYTWPTIEYLFEKQAVDWNYNSAYDALLCDSICSYIERERPTLAVAVFDQPDSTGHKFGWESFEYLEQCRALDGYVGRIIAAIEKAGIADRTILIFSSDHGGTGTEHGGKTLKEMESPFIIWGKGIKRGFEIEQSIVAYDFAATMAHIFGLQTPQVWTGRPVLSAFEENGEPSGRTNQRRNRNKEL